MPKLIVAFSGRSAHMTEMSYAGKTMKAGEEFEASDTDARVLKAIGRAADAPAGVVKQPRRAAPPTRSPEPRQRVDLIAAGDQGAAGSQGGLYSRRDLGGTTDETGES
jgi:hypothetical protein